MGAGSHPHPPALSAPGVVGPADRLLDQPAVPVGHVHGQQPANLGGACVAGEGRGAGAGHGVIPPLTSTDPFFADKGVDLGLLRSQWNRLGSAGKGSKAGRGPASREDFQRFAHLRPGAKS